MKRTLTLLTLFLTQLVFGQNYPRPIIVKDSKKSVKQVSPTYGNLAGTNIIYSEDFESASSLSAKGIAVITAASDGGFKIGTSATASTGQVWKVPANTKFVYTNDDACNCNKSQDSLIIPIQNLLISKVYQLRFSVYFDALSAKEEAFVIAKNGLKTTALSSVKSASGWQEYIVPLSGLAGNTQIVFVYNDGGLWSGGLAIDNIAICEPPQGVNLGLESISFNGLNSSNAYREYPAHHASKMPLKIESNFINLGRYSATNAQVDFTISGYGSSRQTSLPLSLLPNSDTLVTLHPNYIPASGIGNYEMLFVNKSDSVESETSKDSLKFNLNITDTVISRVGDENPTSGFWFGPNQAFDLSSLVEIKTPDTANSVSVFIHSSSKIGAVFDVMILNEFFQDNVVPPVFPPVGTEIKVTQKMLGNWNTFKIPDTYLKTGKYYTGFRTRGDEVLVGVSEAQSQDGVSFLNIGTGYASSNYLPCVKLNLKSRSCAINAAVTITKSTCGGTTGSAGVTVSRGSAPISYLWSQNAGSSNLNSIAGLSSGLYGVTVSDTLGCSLALPVTISDTNGPSISLKNSTNEICFGDLAGSISVSASSGIAPYTFAWSDGQSDSTIQNLRAGSYALTLTDNTGGGCKTIENFTISGPKAPLSVDFVVEDNKCFNDTMGSIRANVFGGVPNYKYAWEDTSKKLNVNSGLMSGTYRLTITDTNNCTLVDSVRVNGSTPIVINLNVLDTGNVGAIEAAVSGGNEPLNFKWTGPTGFRNPGTKNLSDLLIQGKYTLEVTDADGCEFSELDELAGVVAEDEVVSPNRYKLFPNPSKGKMYLDFSTATSGHYSVYNIAGKLVHEEQFREQSVMLINKLNAGVYILNVNINNVQVKYKLIFQD